MTRQDFDKWKGSKAKLIPDVQSMIAWESGADAAYSLLSKEISEKDEQLQILDALKCDCGNELEKAKQEIIKKEAACNNMIHEMERLEELIEKAHYLSICDLPDDEQIKLWQQFKTENNL